MNKEWRSAGALAQTVHYSSSNRSRVRIIVSGSETQAQGPDGSVECIVENNQIEIYAVPHFAQECERLHYFLLHVQ